MGSSPHNGLTFDELARRLVREVSKLIHSGAVTERRLAAEVGLSQPHLHNVANGQRNLTPPVADQIMRHLDWSVLDLIESEEAEGLLSRRRASSMFGREIPLSRSAVGAGFHLPGEELAEISVPNSWLKSAENPCAVSAGCDGAMERVCLQGDILLIDIAPSARRTIQLDALYVVRWKGESVLRWLRYSTRGLYLVTDSGWFEPLLWTLASGPASGRLDIVEGRVIAVARPPDGTFQRPVPPSVSN